jgi:predicted dehydrogenase
MHAQKSSPSRTPAAIDRRAFLKSAAAVGASALLAPRAALASASSAAPSGKVNLACVGIGNRGADVIKALAATGQANIVALCDTDMGAKHTLEILNQFPDVPRFQDFRRMFDKMGRDIDAVSVCTPDHSHFAVAILAMSLGKHVYVEKPLAHTYHQIALLMQAETKYRVAAQMGNQGHSEANYFQFKAWTEAGIIRNVTRITAFMNNPRRWHGKRFYAHLPEQPVPESLDWETWLTSVQPHAYNAGYANGEWRSWYDFGNGALGDWGAHIFDTAHEFLDLGLPVEVVPVRLEGHSQFIFPQASTLAFKFPARGSRPPVELTWYDGVNNVPPLPRAFGEAVVDPNIPPPSAGTIDTRKHPPGKVIYGEGLTFKGGSHASTLEIIPASRAKDMASRLPEVPKTPSNHFLNFLRACRGEEKCRSPFAVSGPLCQMMALGVIAQRLNTKVVFDRASQQITNDSLANELLVGPPPRNGWEQFYRL